jgi:hypothetical protein
VLIAAAPLLGVAGVVVVTTWPSPTPNDLGFDCQIPVDAGNTPGTYECTGIVLPDKNAPPDECAALLGTGGEPPGIGQDAGLANNRVVVERALEGLRKAGAIETYHCEPLTDAGAQPCYCEVRAPLVITANGKLDGPAAALHDVIDANGAGSIVVNATLAQRVIAKHGACRAHVFAGEDPCAGSAGFDAGPDPSDAGP